MCLILPVFREWIILTSSGKRAAPEPGPNWYSATALIRISSSSMPPRLVAHPLLGVAEALVSNLLLG
jgi:hypothetical protein